MRLATLCFFSGSFTPYSNESSFTSLVSYSRFAWSLCFWMSFCVRRYIPERTGCYPTAIDSLLLRDSELRIFPLSPKAKFEPSKMLPNVDILRNGNFFYEDSCIRIKFSTVVYLLNFLLSDFL